MLWISPPRWITVATGDYRWPPQLEASHLPATFDPTEVTPDFRSPDLQNISTHKNKSHCLFIIFDKRKMISGLNNESLILNLSDLWPGSYLFWFDRLTQSLMKPSRINTPTASGLLAVSTSDDDDDDDDDDDAWPWEEPMSRTESTPTW